MNKLSRCVVCILGAWVYPFLVFAQAFPKINIPHIEEYLKTHLEFKQDDSVDAWVMTTVAVVLPFPIESVKQAILNPSLHLDFFKVDPKRYWLQSYQTDLRSQEIAVDPFFLTGDPGLDIVTCSLQKCQVKLHPEEIKILTASSTRVQSYLDIIKNRISLWRQKQQYRGYDRDSNNSVYGAFLQSIEPPIPSNRWNSILFQGHVQVEILDFLKASFGKTIFKMYVQSEYHSPESFYLFNFGLYNNHFFDSSMTLTVLKPLEPRQTLYVSSFNTEVDELKKGFFVHLIFKPKFFEYQRMVLKTVLKKLEDHLTQKTPLHADSK